MYMRNFSFLTLKFGAWTYFEVNSWGYPLNLLAKVNSHAYVCLYFEITLNCSFNVLKRVDVCVTKR